ncbi:response regulator [Massilia sp. SYSU DXS3249]
MILQEPKRRVLVVDDNSDAAETLASLLTILDCTVQVAYSGAEALLLGDRLHPECVVLDIMMPGMNGCELARRMRERAWGRHACIVALTAWGDDDTRRRTAEAGIDIHLMKPVSAQLLLGALKSGHA